MRQRIQQRSTRAKEREVSLAELGRELDDADQRRREQVAKIESGQSEPNTVEHQPTIGCDLARVLSATSPKVLAQELATKTTIETFDLLDDCTEEARQVLLLAIDEPLKSLFEGEMATPSRVAGAAPQRRKGARPIDAFVESLERRIAR